MIAQAKSCKPPTELETGTIVGGFAHNQVLALADKVVEAVKSGAIKRFIVMAGCDGRHKSRQYFTDVADNLPKDTVILTAGCAKFRYNKLQPRRYRRHPAGARRRPVQRFVFAGGHRPETQGGVRPRRYQQTAAVV